ncbi:exosortase/archaeosortase family protein [Aliifodinibius salipaludis]|uniref:Exosortase/archaeosortase family protein n=1 Tax=Fodinibius salipaludis TaxID=2032627 RepID=A0A2A2G8J3_9BACT|nr:archaeosortase/exosortase family protein [Aliifodinibius salipaludis]PAU93152.1 exosortase/archaeosortase family protein [Aliifodinibius salipaludis]
MQWFKSEAGIFALKVAGIYLLWYLIYALWLLPDGSLDQWVATNIVSVSAGLLEMMNYDVYATGRLMGIGELPGIYLGDGGSGISAVGLLVGFVMAYRGAWIPRIAFIFIGIGVIYLVNIIRVFIFTLTQAESSQVFAVTGDFSTTAVFYGVISVLCIVWVNVGDDRR